MNFHDNPKNKNLKIDFTFDSALCASFMATSEGEGGGGGSLHILIYSVGKNPASSGRNFFFALFDDILVNFIRILSKNWNSENYFFIGFRTIIAQLNKQKSSCPWYDH